ncbi:hypothetical protein [Adhaeribacter terreus]|uniref:Uncharacterized protein n=1 Tax=Adhaeribacter terreus TaxID=529703 RepID=A0ABW0ECJ4_9BACT
MHKIFGFIVLLLLFSCDKEKEVRTASLQPPLVTGFLFRDFYGNPIQQVGNPNVKTEGTDAAGYRSYMTVYPNPVRDKAQVTFYSPTPAGKKSLWIVAGLQDQNLNSHNFMQASFPQIGGQPLLKIDLEPDAQSRVLTLNLDNFPAGAYRVYLQLGDLLLWDNILKTN